MSPNDRPESRPAPAWAHAGGHVDTGHGPVAGDPADRQLILERIHRYCLGYDERRSAELADCFTEDAVWAGNVMGETPVGPIEGRDAIVAWLSNFWPVQHDQRRHMILNHVVEAQSSREATVVAYLLLLSARDAAVSLETMGFYRYEAVRESDAWRIRHLFAGFDAPFWPGRLEDLSAGGRRRHGVFQEVGT